MHTNIKSFTIELAQIITLAVTSLCHVAGVKANPALRINGSVFLERFGVEHQTQRRT